MVSADVSVAEVKPWQQWVRQLVDRGFTNKCRFTSKSVSCTFNNSTNYNFGAESYIKPPGARSPIGGKNLGPANFEIQIQIIKQCSPVFRPCGKVSRQSAERSLEISWRSLANVKTALHLISILDYKWLW